MLQEFRGERERRMWPEVHREFQEGGRDWRWPFRVDGLCKAREKGKVCLWFEPRLSIIFLFDFTLGIILSTVEVC